MLTLDEAINRYERQTEELYNAIPCDGCAFNMCKEEHRQLAEWLKRLKRIEDYIADGKDDMECTYSLCFWEIEAVMNGEI